MNILYCFCFPNLPFDFKMSPIPFCSYQIPFFFFFLQLETKGGSYMCLFFLYCSIKQWFVALCYYFNSQWPIPLCLEYSFPSPNCVSSSWMAPARLHVESKQKERDYVRNDE